MSTILPASPWRLLILDREPDDPRWMLATITLPSDIETAAIDPLGRYTGWTEDVVPWVTAQVGQAVELEPAIAPRVWHVSTRRSA